MYVKKKQFLLIFHLKRKREKNLFHSKSVVVVSTAKLTLTHLSFVIQYSILEYIYIYIENSNLWIRTENILLIKSHDLLKCV